MAAVQQPHSYSSWECPVFRVSTGYAFAYLARCAWYAFQPGRQPVCQRHGRAIKVFLMEPADQLLLYNLHTPCQRPS